MVKKFTLNSILITICILTYVILLLGLINIGNINNISLIILTIIYIISIIFVISCYFTKKNIIYNIGIIITLILTIINIYQINNLNNTYSYLTNILYKEYKYNTYNIYVNKKNTTYSNINKLNGKTIGMLQTNSNNIQTYLDEVSNINYKTYQTSDELIIAFTNGEVQSIILSTEEYNNLNNEDHIKSKIISIYSNKIKEVL